MTDRFETKPGVKLPEQPDPRPKRFYKEVSAAPAEPAHGEGHAVLLDGRPVRTPGKAAMVLPSEGLAAGVADEWRAQGERIDPLSMPLTRLSFATLDRDPALTPKVVDEVARYAETDLVCYRADAPAALAEAQAAAWDGALDWARRRFGVQFNVTTGMAPVAQPDDAASAVRDYAGKLDAWRLTALAQSASLTGSALLALMLLEGELDAAEAHARACVDERYQADHWGEDHDAAERLANLSAELEAAGRFIAALNA